MFNVQFISTSFNYLSCQTEIIGHEKEDNLIFSGDELIDRHRLPVTVLLDAYKPIDNLNTKVADDADTEERQHDGDLGVDTEGGAAGECDDESYGLPKAVVAEGSLCLAREDHTVERWGCTYDIRYTTVITTRVLRCSCSS